MRASTPARNAVSSVASVAIARIFGVTSNGAAFTAARTAGWRATVTATPINVAAVGLLRRTGASVENAGFVIDLFDLGGAEKLREMGVASESLVRFPGH